MTLTQKIIVGAYRYLATAVLATILSTAIGYALVTVFYIANNTWAAPVVISRTNEKILRLTAEIFRSKQAADALDNASEALSRESQALREQSRTLEKLIADADNAASRQRQADARLSREVEQLEAAKRKDIANTSKVLSDINSLEAALNRDLRAGLITREDAVRMRATLNGYKTSATDSAATRVALENQLSDLRRSVATLSGGPAQMPQALELLARISGYRMQLESVRLKRVQNETEAATKQKEARQLREMIATLSDSPYFRVTQSTTPLSFAFVPYDNESAAQQGQGVFDCLLHVIVCRRVGTITRVHHDEERAQHPLFRLETRGFLVELQLDDPQAGKSRVLFLGRAPLFI